ncbi:MAG TPA: hypothetical protein VIZ43_10885 [Trebonia sp.]
MSAAQLGRLAARWPGVAFGVGAAASGAPTYTATRGGVTLTALTVPGLARKLAEPGGEDGDGMVPLDVVAPQD